jgi:L-fucose isomerase
MLNDERPHVNQANEAGNMEVLRSWKRAIEEHCTNVDGSAPEIVVGSSTISSVAKAQQIGEDLRRSGCRSVILCFNVWDFPFLVWPFINTLGRDLPILSLSNNNGAFPGNVGLLATDGALRQAGLRTHRIVGDVADAATLAAVEDWVRAAQAVTTSSGSSSG